MIEDVLNGQSKYHIEQGDVLDVLASWPAECVQTVVTSPPYWNLRDYSVEGQIGLESTPEEYVEKMVQVFRAVRRVLRKDGTCWANFGDSYAANRTYQVVDNKHKNVGNNGSMTVPKGLKPKDLCMIPARVALALQADGWWLRSVIIWSKPNPMPESVTDRPTTSHEYIYLLSRSADYYYDASAIMEPAGENTHSRGKGVYRKLLEHGPQFGSRSSQQSWAESTRDIVTSRNKRTVWEVPSRAFPGSHFATFPPKLIEPCILAGTSERGCCPECGAPWERVVERGMSDYERLGKRTGSDFERDDYAPNHDGQTRKANGTVPSLRAAPVLAEHWQPTCTHDHAPVPCVVLDPFMGAGTTALVALRHNRRAVGAELNQEYIDMADRRIAGDERANQMHMELTA